MKKRLLILVAAIVMSFSVVTTAFAGNSNKGGSINAVEERLLARFDGIMSSKSWSTHRDQYYSEARAALLDSRIDLDDAAEAKFNSILDQIDGILNTCSTQNEAWVKHGQEIIGIVNGVSKSYKMTVTVDAVSKDATVTIAGDSGSSSVVATTSKIVKQTGFDLGQTAVVVFAATAVLAGALIIARKSNANA